MGPYRTTSIAVVRGVQVRRTSLPVLLALVVASSGLEARDDAHKGSKVALAELLVAAAQVRAGVDVEQQLASFHGDVLELAHDVLAAYWRSVDTPPVPPQLALDIVQRIAAATKGRPMHGPVVRALERWGRLNEEEWGRERRLALTESRLAWLHRVGLTQTLLRAAQVTRAEERLAEGSLFTWRARRYRGFAYGMRGDAGRSREQMRLAGEQAMSAAWYPQAARSFADAGRLSQALGQQTERGQDESRAWEAARASADPAHIVRTALVLAASLQDEHRYDDSLAILEEARDAARTSATPRSRFGVLRLLRRCYARQRRHEDALAVAQEFVAFAKKLGNEVRQQEGMFLQGAELIATGRLAESLRVLEAAAALRPQKAEPGVRISVLNRLSAVRSMLGDARGGLEAAREATNLAVANGWKQREATSRYYQAGAYWRLGQLDQSEQASRAALALLDPETDTLAIAELRVQLGQIAERRKQWDEAEKRYQEAIRLYEQNGDEALTRGARIVRAALELHRGRPEQAIERLDVLRGDGRAAFIDRSLVESFYARAAIRANRPREALASAKVSLQEHLRSFEGLAAGDTLSRQSRTGDLAYVGLQACAALLGEEGVEEAAVLADALWFLEVSRALQLIQALGRVAGTSTLPPALAAADHASRARLRRARRRFLSVSTRASATPEEVSGARGDLDAAWRVRDDVVRRIERESRRDTLLARIAPVGVEALRAMLAPGERYVAYACSDSRIFAMVASPSTVRLRDLGPVGDTADLVEGLRRRLSAPAVSADTLSTRLHGRLVAPLAADLKGATRLLVSPDPILAAVPFGALRGKSGRYVVEDHEVLLVASATAHRTLRKQAGSAGSALFAVANPPSAPLLPALPASEKEVSALGQRFPASARHVLVGADASVTNVQRTLGDAKAPWRIAHFACHGVLDPQRPEASGLVLAGPEVWTADAVAASKIEADLVVLSACNTARGVPALGEGLLGLGRAFLWAGARHVLASAWRVEDRATAAFFDHFYAAHIGKGLDPAEALRAAQLVLIKSGGAEADPSCWAAFVVWG